MHSDYYVKLRMKLNFEKLLEESKQIDYKALAIKASAAQDTWFEYAPTWKYGKCDEKRNKKFGYFEHLYHGFSKMLDAHVVPNFIKQDANTHVPMHRDSGTICSINILLDEDSGPITFEDIGDIYYRIAFVNVGGKRHMVKPFPKERILLKYSVKDKSYEDCLRKIPNTFKY